MKTQGLPKAFSPSFSKFNKGNIYLKNFCFFNSNVYIYISETSNSRKIKWNHFEILSLRIRIFSWGYCEAFNIKLKTWPEILTVTVSIKVGYFEKLVIVPLTFMAPIPITQRSLKLQILHLNPVRELLRMHFRDNLAVELYLLLL